MAPPLSAAESQQRYRARRDADPERRQQYLENGREKWKRDREKGIHTGINDVSEREKRAKRKKWREAKRATRAKARRSQDTPPATPDNQPETGSGPPRQRRQGEKRTRIGRRKRQRDMALLKAQLDREIRSKEKYRDISCFCQRLDGQLDCACFDLKVATLDGVPVPPPTQTPPTENRETPWRPEEVDSKYIGDWCVVKYDDDVYPGIIMDVEEHSIRVKCMHRNGVNKFCWPSPRDDVSWYADDQLLCLIPEPQALNKRSVQLEKSTWKYMEDHYVN
ncbi:uncharacterized protein LOC133647790 [Entelurus aequoreus]|uniref:uncharacterized protein LOC133647790 n=1 Tax=Entelurus aequoreus TaxID=161455 RepID=UPI002B1D4BCD|nr:uncharacterized protein LOC133647790 [Entelurus aequoreus]